MNIVLFNHSSLVRHEPTIEQIELAAMKGVTPKGTPLSKQPVPRVTVAGIVDGKTLRLGVSRCSTKDQFSKQKGRNVAKVRATERPSKIVAIPSIEEGKLGRFFYEQAQLLIKDAQQEVRIPRYKSGEILLKPVANDTLMDKEIQDLTV